MLETVLTGIVVTALAVMAWALLHGALRLLRTQG